MRGAYQVLSDCPHCRVESALVELMDASERISVALSARCRLCAYTTELGDITQFGHPFVDPAEVIDALTRWALEDGEADLGLFVLANFSGRTPAGVAAAVLGGERVTTSFDVIAFLFPGGGGGGAPALSPSDAKPGAPDTRINKSALPAVDTDAPPPGPPPIARALASVMLADGQIRPAERKFLDVTVQKLGSDPLTEADLRVWRPHELARPADPATLLTAMRALALCDREADGSELRVLKEYARAWQLEFDERAVTPASPMQQLGRSLLALFIA